MDDQNEQSGPPVFVFIQNGDGAGAELFIGDHDELRTRFIDSLWSGDHADIPEHIEDEANIVGDPDHEEWGGFPRQVIFSYEDGSIQIVELQRPLFPLVPAWRPNPEMIEVLELMLWQTTPIAHALRASGKEIPRKSEKEQAHVLSWMLGLAAAHGPTWRDEVERFLGDIVRRMEPGEDDQG